MYLRPPAPKSWESDPDEWLDSNNIADVLNQFEEKYPSFEFMGPFPIDFAAPDPYASKGGAAAAGAGEKKCLITEICELRVKKAMESGTTDIGIVYNLDPHFKGGSHWVGLYIDLKDIEKPFVGYSDSYGMKPPALIARLMRFIRLQTPNATLGYNARKFQNSNTECGMYSMYFIICMIAGIPFQQYVKEVVPDQFMLDLRKVLFS
jgi:hypothetical protein